MCFCVVLDGRNPDEDPTPRFFGELKAFATAGCNSVNMVRTEALEEAYLIPAWRRHCSYATGCNP